MIFFEKINDEIEQFNITVLSVFIIEVDERRGRKSRQSYQYVDVLTGTVELFDPESGEHIFVPLGNQLEE